MTKQTFNSDNIPSNVLKGYIGEIQALYGYNKSISYRTIQKDLDELYGIKVDIDRIEENYDTKAISALATDTYLQYKHQGLA